MEQVTGAERDMTIRFIVEWLLDGPADLEKARRQKELEQARSATPIVVETCTPAPTPIRRTRQIDRRARRVRC